MVLSLRRCGRDVHLIDRNDVKLRSRLTPAWKWRWWSLRLGREEAARRLGVTVGTGCRMISCSVASEHWLVSIGNRVTVSSQVLFVTHDGAAWLASDARGRRYRYAPISVGDDVFIGTRSTIMPGVRIDSRVIVAAGSVVTRSVPSGVIVGGVPAKVIGSYEDYLTRALDEWPAESGMSGGTRRDRVDSIVEHSTVPYLSEVSASKRPGHTT